MKTLCMLPGLLGMALLASAQTPSQPAPYRCYAGLQTAGNQYELHYRAGLLAAPPEVIQVAPWQLSVGYAVGPRLAVQVGFAFSAHHFDLPGGVGTNLQGQRVVENVLREDNHQLAVPVLLRYALGQRKARLRADALLGLAWAYKSFAQETHDEVDGQITRQDFFSDRAGNIYFAAGLGLRYVFSRRVEAVGDLTLNRNLHQVPAGLRQQLTGNSLGLTRSINVGLRYCFDLGKPAAPQPKGVSRN